MIFSIFEVEKINSQLAFTQTNLYYQLTTSISNNILTLNSIVYPNPTQGILTIETGIIGQFDIRINTLNGQIIYNTKVDGPTYQIDLSSFEKGVYFITIRSKDFVTTRKIVK